MKKRSRFKEAGQGARTHLGVDHPLTMQILYNLGGLYLEQANYQEAARSSNRYEARRANLAPTTSTRSPVLTVSRWLSGAAGDFQSAEPSSPRFWKYAGRGLGRPSRNDSQHE